MVKAGGKADSFHEGHIMYREILPKKSPSKAKPLSYTETHIHSTVCVHVKADGTLCGEPCVIDSFKGRTQNGWLCTEHDGKVFR